MFVGIVRDCYSESSLCKKHVTKKMRKVKGNIGPVQDFICKEAILCVPYEILYLSIILCVCSPPPPLHLAQQPACN
jgi:hypothetical protein